MKHTVIAVIALALTSVAGFSFAQRGDRPPHPPPPEAFEACADLDEGDACTVETPRGELQGTCGYLPNLENLICVPPHHRNGPPPPPRD